MENKNALEIVKEMTQKIKLATESLLTITEKRYQYSKDECETIFNNVFKAVDEYVAKAKDETAYETLLNSLSDRFKISTTGGDISRQVDNLSTAEELYEKQTEYQELLDTAKDVIEFITDKAEKIEGIAIKKATSEEVPSEENIEEDKENPYTPHIFDDEEPTVEDLWDNYERDFDIYKDLSKEAFIEYMDEENLQASVKDIVNSEWSKIQEYKEKRIKDPVYRMNK